MERKAKTLIERFGFVDPDREKPSHDQIQIWVYNNFPMIVRRVFPSVEVENYLPLDIKLEYPVSDQRNFVVGFIDVYCRKLSIGIEIKSEIPRLGDLVRQIQYYRKYVTGSWIVVSPDDRSAGILIDQGIHFFKYDNSMANNQLELFQSFHTG